MNTHQKTAAVSSRMLSRFRGEGSLLPPKAPIRVVFLAWFGGVITMSALSGLTLLTATPLVLGSFGATCVLVFAYPDVPFSQPRNILLGHLLSSLTGLVFLAVFGPHWWVVGIATGTSIALMMLTRSVHPPAGSNPVIVFLYHPSWSFILYPTLVGVLMIIIVAMLYNNATRSSGYPRYW